MEAPRLRFSPGLPSMRQAPRFDSPRLSQLVLRCVELRLRGPPRGVRMFMKLRMAALAIAATVAWAGVLAAGARAQDLKSFEQRITTKVLPNGLTLIVCERPEAPVFSYSTFVDAGDVNDPSGESGLAHMFEHLAFKGTNRDRHHRLRRREDRARKGRSRQRRLRGRVPQARGPRPQEARRAQRGLRRRRRTRRTNTSSPTSSPMSPSATARTA